MKKSLHCIFILLLVSYYTQAKNKEDFPDQLKTSKTEKHQQVAGTRIYGIFPPEYKLIKELCRFQKSDSLYIHFLESRENSYIEGKPNATRQAMEAKGAKVDVHKYIRLNEFEAIYTEGPSKIPGETKIALFFGDSSFVVIIGGVCKTTDIAGKKELQEIFKTIFYDLAAQVDIMELAAFEFDHSITGFEFAMNMSGLYMYAEHGKADAKNNTANSMSIFALPGATEENPLTYINQVFAGYARNGIWLENRAIVSSVINNNPAYITETKIMHEGKSGRLYFVMLLNGGKRIIFAGYDYSSEGKYIGEYKKTAESLKAR